MPATLTHGRRVYTVEVTDHPDVPYLLVGPGGGRYHLMRNVPRPHMLFLVNATPGRRTTPFVWVREAEDGTLTVAG